MWFCCMKKKNSLIEDERKDSTEGAHSLEPQKAHPTTEFILGSQNDGCALLYLASSLATVVSETEI